MSQFFSRHLPEMKLGHSHVFILLVFTLFCQQMSIAEIPRQTRKPGIDVRFTQKAVDSLCQYGANSALDKLKQRRLAPQTGRNGKLYYTFTNLRLTGLSRPKVGVSLEGKTFQGFHVDIKGLSAKLEGDWRIKYKGFPPISGKGSFRAGVYGLGVAADVAVSLDSSNATFGRPRVKALGCRGRVDSVSISFSGGLVAFVLNLLKETVTKRARKALPGIVCDETSDAVNVRANRALQRLRLDADFEVRVPNGAEIPLEVDYSLTSPPKVEPASNEVASFASTPPPPSKPASIEFDLKGEISLRGKKSGVPFDPPSLDQGDISARMVSGHVSSFVFNSAFYSAYKSGQIDFRISRGDLKSGDRDYLNTTCEFSLAKKLGCVGTLASSLPRLFPNASTELNAFLAAPPEMRISNASVEVDAVVKIRWFVVPFVQSEAVDWSRPGFRFNNSSKNKDHEMKPTSPRYVFTTNHTVVLQTTPYAEEGKLKIRFEKIRATIRLEDAVIPMKDFHSSIFQLVVNVVANSQVLPKLNDVVSRGLPLPSVAGIGFVDETLRLQKDAILLGFDLRFD